MLTDEEIVDALVRRDEEITHDVFYCKYRALFRRIIDKVFYHRVGYDECISELYLYLMEDDARRLRMFSFRCSLYNYIKIVAIRFFIKKRDSLIDFAEKESLDKVEGVRIVQDRAADNGDVVRILKAMPNRRYAHVLEETIIHDKIPKELAKEMGVSVENLYNIKARAAAQFAKIAIEENYYHEKGQ